MGQQTPCEDNRKRESSSEEASGGREGPFIFNDGPFYPVVKLAWWRRPKASTQNPKNLLPLPCCASWGKLLTLSGLISERRQGD